MEMFEKVICRTPVSGVWLNDTLRVWSVDHVSTNRQIMAECRIKSQDVEDFRRILREHIRLLMWDAGSWVERLRNDYWVCDYEIYFTRWTIESIFRNRLLYRFFEIDLTRSITGSIYLPKSIVWSISRNWFGGSVAVLKNNRDTEIGVQGPAQYNSRFGEETSNHRSGAIKKKAL